MFALFTSIDCTCFDDPGGDGRMKTSAVKDARSCRVAGSLSKAATTLYRCVPCQQMRGTPMCLHTSLWMKAGKSDSTHCKHRLSRKTTFTHRILGLHPATTIQRPARNPPIFCIGALKMYPHVHLLNSCSVANIPLLRAPLDSPHLQPYPSSHAQCLRSTPSKLLCKIVAQPSFAGACVRACAYLRAKSLYVHALMCVRGE